MRFGCGRRASRACGANQQDAQQRHQVPAWSTPAAPVRRASSCCRRRSSSAASSSRLCTVLDSICVGWIGLWQAGASARWAAVLAGGCNGTCPCNPIQPAAARPHLHGAQLRLTALQRPHLLLHPHLGRGRLEHTADGAPQRQARRSLSVFSPTLACPRAAHCYLWPPTHLQLPHAQFCSVELLSSPLQRRLHGLGLPGKGGGGKLGEQGKKTKTDMPVMLSTRQQYPRDRTAGQCWTEVPAPAMPSCRPPGPAAWRPRGPALQPPRHPWPAGPPAAPAHAPAGDGMAGCRGASGTAQLLPPRKGSETCAHSCCAATTAPH